MNANENLHLFDPVSILIDPKGLLQVKAINVARDSFQHPFIAPEEEMTR